MSLVTQLAMVVLVTGVNIRERKQNQDSEGRSLAIIQSVMNVLNKSCNIHERKHKQDSNPNMRLLSFNSHCFVLIVS